MRSAVSVLQAGEPEPPTAGPFRSRTLIALVAIAAASLGVTVALWLDWGGTPEISSYGADSFSRSALGHRAFVALLRANGVPVLVSQYESDRRAAAGAVLVVAEPELESASSGPARRLRAMLGQVRTALVVLPKWSGRPDPVTAAWVGEVKPLPDAAIAATLTVAGIPATLVHQAGDGAQVCSGAGVAVTLTRAQLLTATNSLLQPVIACPGGILLGEIASAKRRLLVLSDPDLLANHGLGRGENARIALDVVDEARGARQALVIDETLHGHEQVPSLWRDLLRFPLWPALLQAALALGFWLWSGWGRFGAPLPEPVGLAAGKSVLIDNTASLLAAAGHSSYTLGRYFDVALFDVARALHAPPGAKPPAIEQIVRAAGRRKGATVDFGQLREQVERLKGFAGARPEAVVSVARRVHRWRNELVRGGGIGASHPH